MYSLAAISLRALVPVVRGLNYVIPFYRAMSSRTVKINFNPRHLKKGDPLPPYNGKLRIYNMRYCPYAQRTILVLNAKQLDYEVVNIDLVEKPDWLTSKSMFAKVPSIEIEDGVCIVESLITSEYLDEVYPQRPLMPKDPVKKALDKIIIEASSPVQSLLFNWIKFPETVTEKHFAAYFKYLDFVQDQLKNNGTKFLNGAQPGYVDYMIWPWFERFIPVSELDERFKIDPAKYKILMDYFDNMFKDPAVSQYLVPKDILFKFLDGYKSGNTAKYDFLTEN